MPVFGSASNAKLDTCDPRIGLVMREAVKIMDMTVIFGYRSPETQMALFKQGRKEVDGEWTVWDKSKIVTQLDGIKKVGKHNVHPAKAVDMAPYPVDWSNNSKAVARFYLMAGVVLACAEKLGVELRWGGDWDGDWDLFDQKFDDLGHFEIVD